MSFFNQITDTAISTCIQNLYTSLDEESLIKNVVEDISDIVPYDFYGFSTLPSSLNKKTVALSNNSDKFMMVYFEELIEFDFFLESMIENRRPVSFKDLLTEEIRKNNFFFNECENLRPTKDCCYYPLSDGNRLLGFIGFGRLNDVKVNFSVEEIEVMRFLTSFIIPAFKNIHSRTISDEKAAYINTSGKIVIAGEQIKEALINIFGNNFWEDPSNGNSINSSVYKNKIEEMISSKLPVVNNIITFKTQNKTYVIEFSYSFFEKEQHNSIIPDLPRIKAVLKEVEISFPDLENKYKQFQISKREKEIADLVIKGYSNKEISEQLCVSMDTVKKHLYNIFTKTGVKSRTQLIFLLHG